MRNFFIITALALFSIVLFASLFILGQILVEGVPNGTGFMLFACLLNIGAYGATCGFVLKQI